MRPRGIRRALDRIDARHLKAPSAFEHRPFTVRVVVLDHDQPGIVDTDWWTFNHDAIRWQIRPVSCKKNTNERSVRLTYTHFHTHKYILVYVF